MHSFVSYLFTHHLIEVSQWFDRQGLNALFRQEIEKAIPTITDPLVRKDTEDLLQFDLVGYLDRSLRRGVGLLQEDDLDEAVQKIVVKLLVSPGTLFTGRNRMSPMSARLKTSIRNAVISIGQRWTRHRRRSHELPSDLAARGASAGDDILADFREWLRVRYGEPFVRVFDARIANEEIKSLIGSEGIPSSYALKAISKAIKAAALTWSRSSPQLNFLVQNAMGDAEKTVAKRFRRERVAATD
jgi:hypothetical protein